MNFGRVMIWLPLSLFGCLQTSRKAILSVKWSCLSDNFSYFWQELSWDTSRVQVSDAVEYSQKSWIHYKASQHYHMARSSENLVMLASLPQGPSPGIIHGLATKKGEQRGERKGQTVLKQALVLLLWCDDYTKHSWNILEIFVNPIRPGIWLLVNCPDSNLGL